MMGINMECGHEWMLGMKDDVSMNYCPKCGEYAPNELEGCRTDYPPEEIRVIDHDGNMRKLSEHEDRYWLRYYAGQALCGLLASGEQSSWAHEQIACEAISQATALMEKVRGM